MTIVSIQGEMFPSNGFDGIFVISAFNICLALTFFWILLTFCFCRPFVIEGGNRLPSNHKGVIVVHFIRMLANQEALAFSRHIATKHMIEDRLA